MSAELVQSYNEQVLSREPHELDHTDTETDYREIPFKGSEELNDHKSVEDEQQQAYRSRNTSTSSSGHSCEVDPIENKDATRGYQEEFNHRDQEEHQLKHREFIAESPQEVGKDENIEAENVKDVIEVVNKLNIRETSFRKDSETVIPSCKTEEPRSVPKPTIEKVSPVSTAETMKSLEMDENDWARKNQGRGKINALIARFNNGSALNESNDNSVQYKSDYGVGKGKGQLRQDVFH